MNMKVLSIVLLVLMCQALRTYQEVDVPEQLDRHEKSSEVEVAAAPVAAEKPAAESAGVEGELKKEVNEQEANVDNSETVKANHEEDAAAALIREATEALANKPAKEADKSDDDSNANVDDKNESALPKKKEVRAQSNEDDENKQVEEPTIEEKTVIQKDDSSAAESKSAAKAEVDYDETDDLKVKPAEPIKDNNEAKDTDLTEIEKKPVEVQDSSNIRPNEESREVKEKIKEEVKEPAAIVQQVSYEQRVVKVENNIDTNANNIRPEASQSQANDRELSGREKMVAGESASNQPPKSGKVNPFFIIVPGIILAFVILIVVVFVLYQKTSLFRSESSLSVPANDTGKRTIYRQVPTDPARAV